MKSKTSAIYAGYLAKFADSHPGMVQPKTLQYKDAAAIASEARKSGKLITAACKFWNDSGEVFEMADGRVIEIVLTSSRLFEVVAVFDARTNWQTFEQPMSYKQYFERW
jgi:hypothetical protein